MIEARNKRGRPKGSKQPETSETYYKRAMLKNEKEGGVRLSSILRGEDVRALERFRLKYNLGGQLSYAQLMKIMIVLLDGKAFQQRGYALTGKVSKIRTDWVKLNATLEMKSDHA